jgi:hypothetical protein
VETADQGSMGDLQNKDIWVRVHDKATWASLLDDKLPQVRARMIEGSAEWPTFDDLTVVIQEVGDPRSSDPADVALVESGPRTLMTIRYRYNASEKRFERVP